ncbi:hypothetical protein ACF1B0_01745 [Streptomyces anandii]|uniref:hypothetical protein n=1 Tax=Streptomyces anandii TaxID=285454 RepID=UPI003700FB23
MTGELNEKKQKAPAELVPSVEQLTATLRAVETPHTPPQDRDAVIRGAQAVSSTLDVISRPGTPPALREQLTGLVRAVVSTLGAGNDPGTPAPDRHAVFLIAEGSASVLGVIGDRRTPQGLREDLAGIVHDVTSVATGRAPGSPGEARRIRGVRTGPEDTESLGVAGSLANQLSLISDPGTSGEGRKDVARATHDASSSLDGANRSGASDEDRDQARKKLPGRVEQTRRQVEKELSAQSLPDVPLDKAAVQCTGSVFKHASEAAVGRHVEDLLPEEWNSEGVKEFWKAQEKDSDFLEVFTQLRNEKLADAPARIAQLIPRLADVVPAGDLFWILGPPSLHCLRAAAQLDEYSGIESGSWVKKAQEME